MSCTKTFASLRIFSKNISPTEMTFALKILPTNQRPRDIGSKIRSHRDTHYWNWSTEGRVNSNKTSEHLDVIIELLDEKQGAIYKLQEQGCQIDIFCFWSFDGQGVISLPTNTMGQLVKLGIGVHWDVYYDDETE